MNGADLSLTAAEGLTHGSSWSPPLVSGPQELIKSMLEVESEQRYTALQVLEHPWVTVSAVGDRVRARVRAWTLSMYE